MPNSHSFLNISETITPCSPTMLKPKLKTKESRPNQISNLFFVIFQSPFLINFHSLFLSKKIDENIVKAKLQNTKKLVVLGSTDQNTQLFASKAAVNDLILISDASTSDEFIDKTRYPNLVRLAFTDSYRYATMANFLRKRNWNHAVIIHGDKGVPETLAVKLNLFGIRFYSIVFPRNAKLGKCKIASFHNIFQKFL